MKKTYLWAVAALFFTVSSCSDDDSNSDNEIETVLPDPTEEIALNPNEVSAGIIINNATAVPGDAPSPSGTLSFTMDETTQSAFQKNGFNISFDAPDNYAGAYIQLIAEDGTPANQYLDVSENGKSTNSSRKKRKGFFTQKTKMFNDQDIEIDVDFEDAVPAGTFCYLICIYDTDGNISEPTEVCVEVEAWGGNSNLVSTWELFKSEDTYDGMTEIQEINVELCSTDSFFCQETEEAIEIENGDCETLTKADLVLNADGTYTLESESTGTRVAFEATQDNNCTPVFEDDNDSLLSIGNWAYDEEEGKLTLVEFEYTEDDYPTEIEEFGYLLFDGPLNLDGDTFTITDEDTFEGELESFVSYFRKK